MEVSAIYADLFSFATVYKPIPVVLQLKHMKKYLMLFAFIGTGLFLSNSQPALATSGACSYHGGVNCSAGPGAYGNVTCNDGWTGSSIAYSSMTECHISKFSCMTLYPTSYSGCRQETDYTNVQSQIEAKYSIMGMIGEKSYLDEKASRLQECRKSIDDYQSIIKSYNQCIQDAYRVVPTQTQQMIQPVIQPVTPIPSIEIQAAPTSSKPVSASSTDGLFDSQGNYQWIHEFRLPTPKTYKINGNLSIGSSGDDVATLQDFLENRGFLKMPNGSNKGSFGMITKKALSAFQKSINLPATGYFGTLTRSKINSN